MKKSSLIVILFVLFSCKGEIIPREIKMKLIEMEPSAHNIVWTIDDNIFQVDYVLHDKKTTSYFDKNGTWLETESEIDFDELPKAILETLKIKLSEYSIIDIELVKTKENQELYEVDLKKGDKIYDILFDKNGKILRKEI